MTERKRALFVVHSYYVRDTRPRRLATSLADVGWEVDVVCAREAGESPFETIAGVRIHRLPSRRRRGSKWRYIFEYVSFTAMAMAYVSLLWLRRRHRVVHTIGVPNFIVFSALVPRMGGARVQLDIRDPLPEFFQAKYNLSAHHPIVRALLFEERVSARFATQVVTVHDSMATLYERSVPRAQISVVMNAADPRRFVPVARAPESRTLLYTGTVAHWYGIDLAVRAVARLRRQIPSLRLRIVGDGELVPALRELARLEGVSDLVDFDDPVPLDAIPKMVAESWLGVQPNRDDPLMRYSLSQKVLEWALMGLPVVAGETRPLREVFTDDEVFFHAAGDLDGMCARILQAHADPAALPERIERARAAAARVDYDEETARFLRVVEAR